MHTQTVSRMIAHTHTRTHARTDVQTLGLYGTLELEPKCAPLLFYQNSESLEGAEVRVQH